MTLEEEVGVLRGQVEASHHFAVSLLALIVKMRTTRRRPAEAEVEGIVRMILMTRPPKGSRPSSGTRQWQAGFNQGMDRVLLELLQRYGMHPEPVCQPAPKRSASGTDPNLCE